MKTLLTVITVISILMSAGCRGISYTEQDAKDNIRQDGLGFLLGLEGHSDTEYSEYGYEEHTEALRRVESIKD